MTKARIDSACLRLSALRTLVLLALVSAPALPAPRSEEAASAKVWVGRAQEFEECLRTTEVVRMEDIPVGVTKPQRAYLAQGSLVESVSFKAIKPGRYHGFWESYHAEIAAYELDKLLDLHMVPPTVEKRVKGDLGAAVMWVKPVQSFKELGGPPTPPSIHFARWNRQILRAKMFDCLIYNKDPNLGNWLVDPAWNLILIDHSRAFLSDKKFAHDLSRVDAELWDRIKSLTEEELQESLGEWLDKRQIRAILERRDMMQDQIDKLVAKNGEASVIVR